MPLPAYITAQPQTKLISEVVTSFRKACPHVQVHLRGKTITIANVPPHHDAGRDAFSELIRSCARRHLTIDVLVPDYDARIEKNLANKRFVNVGSDQDHPLWGSYSVMRLKPQRQI